MRTPAGGAPISTHAFQKGGKPDPLQLARILKPLSAAGPIDAVIASGDLGWSGVDADYAYAHAFFDQLRTELSCPIVVVPGNHDVNLDPGIAEDARQDAYISFCKAFYASTFQHLYPLWNESASAQRRQQLASVHRLLDDALVVVSVNSAANISASSQKCPSCSQPLSASAPVLVNADVLSALEEQLSGLSENALKVFVLHHHLLPFTEVSWTGGYDSATLPDRADPTIVANSARLQSWLAKNGFSVVLHGHKHYSHTRYDVLRRRDDPQRGHEILVLGVGSTGASDDLRATEPLAFYVVDCSRLAKRFFAISVLPMRIHTAGMQAEAIADGAPFAKTVGQPPSDPPEIFSAQTMSDCHSWITRVAKPTSGSGRLISNFISTVEPSEFTVPATAELKGVAVTLEQVRSSFYALHPEYDRAGAGWNDQDHVARVLSDPPRLHRFQHGHRIWGYPLPSIDGPEPAARPKPLSRALESLGLHSSRAYVGLYNPFVDGTTGRAQREQPPCLTGIQFVERHTSIDLVATFRKLELSFWWTVNMFEMHELLKLAAAQRGKQRGRITFFAALAEWKADNPGATFLTDLDELPVEEMVELLLQVADGKAEPAVTRLRTLLAQKIAHTNDVNIDDRGLVTMADVVGGIVASGIGPLSPYVNATFQANTQVALSNIRGAIEKELPNEVDLHLAKAIAALKAMHAQLQPT
jgi:hypothetical protein